MAWMGTRDIYTALILTAVFTVLSDHLFNEESPYCVVPKKYRILAKSLDENNDNLVTEQEINDAILMIKTGNNPITKYFESLNIRFY